MKRLLFAIPLFLAACVTAPVQRTVGTVLFRTSGGATNVTPAFVGTTGLVSWAADRFDVCRLHLTNSPSANLTTYVTLGPGLTNLPSSLMTLIVISRQGPVYRHTLDLRGLETPGGQREFYLGSHLSPTTHVFQIHWDGQTNRLVNAAYYLGGS